MRRSPSGGAGLPQRRLRNVRTASRCWVGAPRRGGRAPRRAVLKTEEARSLVARSDMAPTRGRWHVIVMEDADRLTESANNVLLKSIEEPASRTVWLLCAPSVEDLLPTVRSRCQVVGLRTPATDGFDVPSRGGCRDGGFRRACLHGTSSAGPVPWPPSNQCATGATTCWIMMRDLSDLASCMAAAGNIVAAAVPTPRRCWRTRRHREGDTTCWRWVPVRGQRGQACDQVRAQDLEDRQNARRSPDRARRTRPRAGGPAGLVPRRARSAARAPVELVNEEMRPDLARMADETHVADTLLRIGAIRDARQALSMNVAPQLAMEAMVVKLRAPRLAGR